MGTKAKGERRRIMTFNEAFEKLGKIAAGKRELRYGRRVGDYGIKTEILCTAGTGEDIVITRSHETFEGALVEMAALLAGYKDEPEIEG